MGITFNVIRSREGRYLSVQIPSDDCEIFTSVTPPSSVHESQNSATDNPGVVL